MQFPHFSTRCRLSARIALNDWGRPGSAKLASRWGPSQRLKQKPRPYSTADRSWMEFLILSRHAEARFPWGASEISGCPGSQLSHRGQAVGPQTEVWAHVWSCFSELPRGLWAPRRLWVGTCDAFLGPRSRNLRPVTKCPGCGVRPQFRSMLCLFDDQVTWRRRPIVVQSLSPVWLLWPHGPQHSGLPVLHHLPEFAHIHVHWVGDAIQPSGPLSSPSPPAFSLSQHQGLF